MSSAHSLYTVLKHPVFSEDSLQTLLTPLHIQCSPLPLYRAQALSVSSADSLSTASADTGLSLCGRWRLTSVGGAGLLGWFVHWSSGSVSREAGSGARAGSKVTSSPGFK
ncbi:hypothetical protein scyTo_0005169 [Scyliorhinus torazame]|uniref:Uncharacterized protein n=1 Tax=Scyliorhinus torazame TaxID=75743 RepID=A0A401P3F3_SCYTO|nr:hypothetical protein [Scyliorhinus torazame]